MAIMLTTLVGDITQQKVDAVVNAANRELTGGSGVNGAIHKAGGGRDLSLLRGAKSNEISRWVAGWAVGHHPGR